MAHSTWGKGFYSERARCMVLSPSVCLSVMLVHPTQQVKIFGKVCMSFGTLAIR